MSPSLAAMPPEPGGPNWLNLIRWSYALLLQIWRLLTQLAPHAETSTQRRRSIHRFEPKVLRSLQPRTIKTYQRQVDRLVSWLEDNKLTPEEPHEWDDALCAYLVPESDLAHDLGDDLECANVPRTAPCTRSQADNLLAGVEQVLPRLNHQLVYTKAMLKDWERFAPAHHHNPTPWRCALVTGNQLGLDGYPRLGALHVLQSRTGLRPGELLQLHRED